MHMKTVFMSDRNRNRKRINLSYTTNLMILDSLTSNTVVLLEILWLFRRPLALATSPSAKSYTSRVPMNGCLRQDHQVVAGSRSLKKLRTRLTGVKFWHRKFICWSSMILSSYLVKIPQAAENLPLQVHGSWAEPDFPRHKSQQVLNRPGQGPEIKSR